MVVCLSIGNQSQKVINTIKRSVDNADFKTYGSIKELVKDAKLRHIDFKRIILSTNILKNPEKDLRDLNDFIKEFSSSTEIVLVVGNDNVKTVGKIFNKLFNAPMYTPVVLPKATASLLVELVLSDILALKSKYYSVESSTEEDVGTGEQNANSEKDIESNESSDSYVNEAEPVSNSGQPVSNNSSGFGSGPVSLFPGFGGISGSSIQSGMNNSSEIEDEESNGSGNVAGVEFEPEDSYEEDDNLSIGDYGSQHSDTGFLDADDDEELKAYLEAQNKEEEEEKKSDSEKLAEEAVAKVNKLVESEQSISSDLNIDLVLSTRGHRATEAIVNESLELYRKDDAKILIVDLDVKENRVLSYLNTTRFYSSNAMEGISKKRIYTEDNIGIVSNGYGVPASSKDLKILLTSKLVRKYDLILIDCPVDCLSIIDEELAKMCHVLVYSGASKHDLIEMSLGLTDRNIVELGVERYIMKVCEVEVDGTYRKEDVGYLKSIGLFANGNWVSKITSQ